jgi:tetratricopeptide (TPR) repeat protein
MCTSERVDSRLSSAAWLSVPPEPPGARRAAVHLEAGDYAAAVKDCDAAVERGRELRADFKLIAKALARKGAALAKAGDLESAVAAYHKSLTEHRRAPSPAVPVRHYSQARRVLVTLTSV